MSRRLVGQVAIVTGGRSGIGRAVAIALATEGERRGHRPIFIRDLLELRLSAA